MPALEWQATGGLRVLLLSGSRLRASSLTQALSFPNVKRLVAYRELGLSRQAMHTSCSGSHLSL